MKSFNAFTAHHLLGLSIDKGRLEFVKVLGQGAEGHVLLAKNLSVKQGDAGKAEDEYDAEYYVSVWKATYQDFGSSACCLRLCTPLTPIPRSLPRNSSGCQSHLEARSPGLDVDPPPE